ncbi:MAG: hypothetical protein SFV17_05455 [Candidatus Obscuribacter sp.]|nr:hypothetical protein [Candidatus Obscuribacter sp.]
MIVIILSQARQMVANDFCTGIDNISDSLGKHIYRGKEYQFLHGTKVEELYLMG